MRQVSKVACRHSCLFYSSLRSEIAWRDAKYAQIYEYLREEYEVTQRFGNLDFKLKFVEVFQLSRVISLRFSQKWEKGGRDLHSSYVLVCFMLD